MNYRKLIKEEIAKLHTAKGVKVNPKLDSDLGEQIVADICSRLVKNCSIQNVSGNASDFYTDLMKLINNYCKEGLSKPELVAKMEYATNSCKMS